MFESFFGKSFNPEKDIPSLSGKVILVTGGNTGLGKETCLQLAKHDPKEIVLAARTPSRAEAAIAEIKKAVPNSNISFLQLDLTSFAAIKKAADEFNSRSDRLDVLINNAGIMAVPWSMTKDGYEIQFGTNHMGHALFTKLLLPTLLKTAEQPGADVRIINLSSEAHQMPPSGGIVFDQPELEKCGTWGRYGQSKLANILHARELQKHYPTITSTSLHPGVIMGTELVNTTSGSNPIMKVVASACRGAASMGLMYDVPKGAKNQLWAATADKEEVGSSYYWKPVGVKSGGMFKAKDAQLAEKLWNWTEEEFKKHGY